MDKSNILDVNGQHLSTFSVDESTVTDSLPKNSPSGGNFTQISNQVLLDERLSFKARGILALLLSRPQGWQIYVNEIAKRSDHDGKRAVQSGFKELVTLGYVDLLRVYNDDTGRFEGTCYQLSESIFLPRRIRFKTVREVDSLENRPSEIQTDEKTDSPETASLNNTESSNTKNSNTNLQQQQQSEQEKPVAAAAEEKKDINAFYEDLQKDQPWQQLFVGQAIGQVKPLSQEQFDDLLLHFRQLSLQNGTTYANASAVKRHFGNWFSLQQRKGQLLNFLNEQQVKRKNTHSTLSALLRKTNLLYLPLYERSCKDAKEVLHLASQLQEHALIYKQNLLYLAENERKNVLQALENIDQMVQRIYRGEVAGKLDWFCENRMQKVFSTRKDTD